MYVLVQHNVMLYIHRQVQALYPMDYTSFYVLYVGIDERLQLFILIHSIHIYVHIYYSIYNMCVLPQCTSHIYILCDLHVCNLRVYCTYYTVSIYYYPAIRRFVIFKVNNKASNWGVKKYISSAYSIYIYIYIYILIHLPVCVYHVSTFLRFVTNTNLKKVAR
jgi:hypothetical protein